MTLDRKLEEKKILLLGGAGFIGLNLASYICDNSNYHITIADNLSRGRMDKYLSSLIEDNDIKFIEADFTDPKSFLLLEADYDQCYMLASVVGVENTLSKPHEVIRINTSLILNTLEWLKTSNIRKVVFTSTSENYAGTIDTFGYKIPTPEDIPLSIADISHPRYTYAVTKILGESGFLNYAKVFDFECTVVRYHNVIGPRMGFKHVIPHLAERFIKGEEPFLMYGHDQTRSFCYVSDAVEATFLAMESINTNGEIYHIGTEQEITIEQLIKAAGKFFKYSGKYESATTYPGSTGRRCPDITKASDHFSYKPKISWQKGLEKTLEWYEDFFLKKGNTIESGFKKP